MRAITAVMMCTTSAGTSERSITVTEPFETLDDDPHLDGRYTIAGETLDGYGALDGRASLWYPTLATPDATLDGTTNLGRRIGPPHIHHSGIVRIRRGSTVIQEPI